MSENSRLEDGGEIRGRHQVDLAFTTEHSKNVEQVKQEMLRRVRESSNETLVSVYGAVYLELVPRP